MDEIELTRECEAVQIPSGERVPLPQGTEVYVTQSLGGSFTVQAPSYGGLFRISGQDADALGKEIPEELKAATDAAAAVEGGLEEQVSAMLKTCFDPEIPVNIVDLGLIYDTCILAQDDGSNRVEIKMTLTAPGCGMGVFIAADAEDKIRALPDVSDARVEIVWDPLWNPQMISEEGRKALGIG